MSNQDRSVPTTIHSDPYYQPMVARVTDLFEAMDRMVAAVNADVFTSMEAFFALGAAADSLNRRLGVALDPD